MVAGFHPEGTLPVTKTPIFDNATGVIEVETAGASIGYQVNEGPWMPYLGGVDVEPGDLLRVKAIRYGWQESEVGEFLVP